MTRTAQDEEDMLRRGAIKAMLERKVVGKQLWYLCQERGRQEDEAKWTSLESIRTREPYMLKLARHLDEQLKAISSGMSIRPTTRSEVKQHLKDFGIDGDLVESKIKRFSGGQRCQCARHQPSALVSHQPSASSQQPAALISQQPAASSTAGANCSHGH